MTESEIADFTQRSRNPNEAATYCGVSRSFLAKRRLYGDGPKYIKVGRRKVVYRREDLDAWLAERVRCSTSEVGVPAERLKKEDTAA